MKERPILFSGPMVRAILEGRKTQTRRIVKPQPTPGAIYSCPFGDPGDRLWVKEGLRRGEWEGLPEGSVLYAADDEPAWDLTRPCVWGWKRAALPSMFCPRGLSRITLEVTAVRVERLQDLSEEDAKAEGVPPMLGYPRPIDPSYGLGFRQLWDWLNSKRAPWASNPWVWVVNFMRIEATS